MSARVERAAGNQAVSEEQAARREVRIVGFDAERFKAPFVLRCGAICIDYLLLAAPPVIGLLLAQQTGDIGVKMLKNQSITIGWMVAVLLAITNLIILPVVSGRTAGKFVTGLQVVQNNGANLTFLSAAVRHLIGYPVTILTFGFGFLIAALSPSGRALHDYLSGTIVVRAQRRMVTGATKENVRRRKRD